MSERGTVYRFAGFELDAASSELRQDGGVVKLSPQPCRVLSARPARRRIVSRNDIREQVWSGDTFVDFDRGLNFCIRQIRGRSATTPTRRGSSRRCRGECGSSSRRNRHLPKTRGAATADRPAVPRASA